MRLGSRADQARNFALGNFQARRALSLAVVAAGDCGAPRSRPLGCGCGRDNPRPAPVVEAMMRAGGGDRDFRIPKRAIPQGHTLGPQAAASAKRDRSSRLSRSKGGRVGGDHPWRPGRSAAFRVWQESAWSMAMQDPAGSAITSTSMTRSVLNASSRLRLQRRPQNRT